MKPAAKPRSSKFVVTPIAFGRLLIAVAFVALWEIAGHTVFDPEFLSPPSAIVMALPKLLADPQILAAIGQTLWQLAAAFAIALVVGVVFGVAIGLSALAAQSSLPLILLAYSIPQVTLLPLFVLYFGIGPASKVAFGATHGVFPILLGVIVGVRNCDAGFLKVAKSLGARKLQVIRRIILPSIIPNLFSSLRIGMSATLLGVLLAELYASSGGVGYFARLFSESFNPPATFALVTVLTVMAIALNEMARRLEVRASAWRSGMTGDKV